MANMMIEIAVTSLKRRSRRESQAMAAIVTNSCVKFYLDKRGLVYYLQLINPWRMREGYGSRSVCVCLSYHASCYIPG